MAVILSPSSPAPNLSAFFSPGGTSNTRAVTSTGIERQMLASFTSLDTTVAAVSYAGTPLTTIITNSTINHKLWGLTNPALGPNNMVVTFSSYGQCFGNFAFFEGVNQTTPLGASFESTTTATNTPSITGITATGGELVFGAQFSNYTGSGAPVISQGSIIGAVRSGTNGRTMSSGYRTNAGTLSWTLASAAVCYIVGVKLNPATVTPTLSENSGFFLHMFRKLTSKQTITPEYVTSAVPFSSGGGWNRIQLPESFTQYAQVKYGNPGNWGASGSGWNGMFAAYGDPAYNDQQNKLGIFLGGHADLIANPFTQFSLQSLDWNELVAPVDFTKIPPLFYTPTVPKLKSNPVYPSGFFDGAFRTAPPLTDPADLPYADTKATSPVRHLYGGLTYFNKKYRRSYSTPMSVSTLDGIVQVPSRITWYADQIRACTVNYANNVPRSTGDAITRNALIAGGLASHGNDANGVLILLQEGTMCEVDANGKMWVLLTPGSEGINNRGCFMKVDHATDVVEGIYEFTGMQVETASGTGAYWYPSFVQTPTHVWAFSPRNTTGLTNRGWRINTTTGFVDAFALNGSVPTISSNSGGPTSTQIGQESVPGFYDGTKINLWNCGIVADRDSLFQVDLTVTNPAAAGTTADPFIFNTTRLNMPASPMSSLPTTQKHYRYCYRMPVAKFMTGEKGVVYLNDDALYFLKINDAPIPPATTVATLQISGTVSGTAPFSATVMPLQGEVPNGNTLVTADGLVKSTVLSRHPDNSASVIVVAGTVTSNSNVLLQNSAVADGAALTTTNITNLITSMSINFDSYGTASPTLGTPTKIWWANSKVIHAQYNVAAPSHPSLEAIVYVTAYADRAHVEVVIENAKMAFGALNVASPAPTNASYTNAVVTVNGTALAALNGNGSPESTHTKHRAIYTSTWVGTNPNIRVTQLHTELQKHPLFVKYDQASNVNMATTYGADTYTPWNVGRQRGAVGQTSMGGGGDHPSIGPLTQWEARTLQTGDANGWKATEASTLALLGFGINYRDAATGLVPTFAMARINNLSQNGYSAGNAKHLSSTAYNGNLGWEVAHHPSSGSGLMAFLSRPSAVFIELGQKCAFTNGTYSVTTGGPVTITGVLANNYQTRGRAWGVRLYAQSIFITPDGEPWKDSAKTALDDTITWADGFRTNANATLNIGWENTPLTLNNGYALGGGAPGHGVAAWCHQYCVTEFHKAASAKISNNQAAIETLTDWMALQPVRWINEQSNSAAWRYIPYATKISRVKEVYPPASEAGGWGAQMIWAHADTAPTTVAGPFYTDPASAVPWNYSGYTIDNTAGSLYPSYLWDALVAAKERNVAGASTAYNFVLSNLTSLNTWRLGFQSDPRWGSTPR